MLRIALLGLGTMGAGMAGRLLKAGWPLTVWNRSRERAAAFVEEGAVLADSPQAASAAADVVISMVADDEASRGVWLGENGALSGARAGTILLEASTLSPAWVRELADAERFDLRVGRSWAPFGSAQHGGDGQAAL